MLILCQHILWARESVETHTLGWKKAMFALHHLVFQPIPDRSLGVVCFVHFRLWSKSISKLYPILASTKLNWCFNKFTSLPPEVRIHFTYKRLLFLFKHTHISLLPIYWLIFIFNKVEPLKQKYICNDSMRREHTKTVPNPKYFIYQKKKKRKKTCLNN